MLPPVPSAYPVERAKRTQPGNRSFIRKNPATLDAPYANCGRKPGRRLLPFPGSSGRSIKSKRASCPGDSIKSRLAASMAFIMSGPGPNTISRTLVHGVIVKYRKYSHLIVGDWVGSETNRTISRRNAPPVRSGVTLVPISSLKASTESCFD